MDSCAKTLARLAFRILMVSTTLTFLASQPAAQTFTFTSPPVFSCEISEIDFGEASSLSSLRSALAGDAFAAAFGVFIEDLDESSAKVANIRTGFTRWRERACRPIAQELFRYVSQVNAAVQSGCQGEVQQDVFNRCLAIKNELDAQLAQLQPRIVQADTQRNELEAQQRQVAPLMRRGVQNAKYLLNPDNTEEAFRLYISWVVDLDRSQRSRERSSCESFARIAEALGNRVVNHKVFIELLVRNVVERKHPLVIVLAGDPPLRQVLGWEQYLSRSTRTFNAQGFKTKFYDNVTENQVRHGAGFMLGGYKFKEPPNKLYSFIVDRLIPSVLQGAPQPADYRLAVEGAQMGFQLSRGKILTSDFGGAIRARLCQ
jgi:hypothetical protein